MGGRAFVFFKTEADIHDWFSGKARLSDVHNVKRAPEDNETYEGMMQEYIEQYGEKTHGIKHRAQDLLDRMSDVRAQVASQYLAKPSVYVTPRERLQGKIDNFPADKLKQVVKVLEWAVSCPEPPPRPDK